MLETFRAENGNHLHFFNDEQQRWTITTAIIMYDPPAHPKSYVVRCSSEECPKPTKSHPFIHGVGPKFMPKEGS